MSQPAEHHHSQLVEVHKYLVGFWRVSSRLLPEDFPDVWRVIWGFRAMLRCDIKPLPHLLWSPPAHRPSWGQGSSKPLAQATSSPTRLQAVRCWFTYWFICTLVQKIKSWKSLKEVKDVEQMRQRATASQSETDLVMQRLSTGRYLASCRFRCLNSIF